MLLFNVTYAAPYKALNQCGFFFVGTAARTERDTVLSALLCSCTLRISAINSVIIVVAWTSCRWLHVTNMGVKE